MRIEVRVHTARDRARLYHGHRHPFSSQTVKGWHARPGTETVSSKLRQQQAQSPSGTGRAAFPHRSTSTQQHRCREPSQTDTGTTNLTTSHTTSVDRLTVSLARMRL
jgi:type 1 glutamine amidotransferase